MAEQRAVTKLDERLIKENLVDASFSQDAKKVHSMLNTHLRKSGQILTQENFDKGEERLRSWLSVLYKKGASQERLTAYLRIGLAHLCYDFIASTYMQISSDDLLTRTLVSFKKRKYHLTFFKASQSDLKSKSKKSSKKKAVKKRAGKKAKKSVKKVAGKTKRNRPIRKKSSPAKGKRKKRGGFFSGLFGR